MIIKRHKKAILGKNSYKKEESQSIKGPGFFEESMAVTKKSYDKF